MNTLARPQLVILDGKITTTSNQIAKHFGKRHDTVLRAIENLDCSPEYRLRNGETAGGSLNPTWVEWLMGWPLGWTDLKPLETDKCRSAQQRHGGF